MVGIVSHLVTLDARSASGERGQYLEAGDLFQWFLVHARLAVVEMALVGEIVTRIVRELLVLVPFAAFVIPAGVP